MAGPLFPLGRLVATPGALTLLSVRARISYQHCLSVTSREIGVTYPQRMPERTRSP